ncbi:MAG: hypothetical protein M3R15_23320 [Acidobacteriota bacterium]|nr:hypothetical protein [Acidobacteriota bacterium]
MIGRAQAALLFVASRGTVLACRGIKRQTTTDFFAINVRRREVKDSIINQVNIWVYTPRP